MDRQQRWIMDFKKEGNKMRFTFIADHESGERITYGARAITKGGLNALPKLSFPGGMLVGCDAGTLNFSKIKGYLFCLVNNN